jgi:microcystin-dependent protein
MSGVTDFTPVGAVVAFGGTLDNNGYWLHCDGRLLSKDDHPELFTLIQYTYGGSGNQFNIPDYRGRFLRGTSHASGNDPDASRRTGTGTASNGQPLAGNTVGSIQEDATAVPRIHFVAQINHLPTDSFQVSGETSSAAGPSGSSEHKTCNSGGDGDTRPANVYVNFYIKAKPN